MDFDEAKGFLKRLGIRVTLAEDWRDGPRGRLPVKIPIFRAFVPPFTAKDWVRIARRDGDQYIGGCCSQTSGIQDEIVGWFRDGGAVQIRDLAQVAGWMIVHDSETSPFADLGMSFEDVVTLRAEWKAGARSNAWNDLWFRLAVVWHLVKGAYMAEVPSGFRTDMSEGDKAIATISDLAQAISYHRVIAREERTAQDRTARLLALAKMVPALRYVLEHVHELAWGSGTVTGWALVDLQKGEDVVCQNGLGLCLYDDRAEMESVLDLWKSNAAKHEGHIPAFMEITDRIGIRPMIVDLSCDEGPRFTGPVERVG